MKILLYSYVFLPSVGGIEIVSATLAEYLVILGHEVTLVTETPSEGKDDFTYKVVRHPSRGERIRLVRNHDIIHSNGASLALFFYAKFLRKPFIWTHGGYQLSCIDGLGWVEGELAPLKPWESIKFHFKRLGLKRTIFEATKLYIRRSAAYFVNANIAITNWVAMRQPLPNQQVIYNPFPLGQFLQLSRNEPKTFDFIYVGRLVSEKGVPELIKAFKKLSEELNNSSISLAIVGTGNWRERLEELVKSLGLENQVTFFGKKIGVELHQIIVKSQIAVVPSIWEEPMGGVAIELMAAGKNLIVSKNGGLYECVGASALAFENGNHVELAEKMKAIYTNESLRKEQLVHFEKQLKKFNPLELTKSYLECYEAIVYQ